MLDFQKVGKDQTPAKQPAPDLSQATRMWEGRALDLTHPCSLRSLPAPLKAHGDFCDGRRRRRELQHPGARSVDATHVLRPLPGSKATSAGSASAQVSGKTRQPPLPSP